MTMTEGHLSRLESVGLIRFAAAHPDLEYLFRHALVQDAAYVSILRADRKRLHRLVGQVGEQMYADRLAEFAPVLARHFHEAGDTERALDYYRQAGDHAAQHYALQEAVAHYNSALALAGPNPPPGLLRARGGVYDLLGNAQEARADLQAALAAAAATGDAVAEWQALTDIGVLWTGRAYGQALPYFERAHALALRLNDPVLLGRSLNNLGNWHLNMEDPAAARTHHQQALALFEAQDDRAGLADTLDLLGMMSYVGCDLVASRRYYEQAAPALHALDNRPILMSTLAVMALGGPNYQSSTLRPAFPAAEAIRRGAQAVGLARSVGVRSAEAFALNTIGIALGGAGQYEAGLTALRDAATIAAAISHRQWAVAAAYTMGQIYSELLAPELAIPLLEQACTLAAPSDSRHWIKATAAALGAGQVAAGNLDIAATVLAAAAPPDLPPTVISSRMIWRARAELALAQNAPAVALDIVDRRLRPLPDGDSGADIPCLVWLRGAALARLGHPDAEGELARVAGLAADSTAEILWRATLDLAHLYATQGRHAEAEAARAATLRQVESLAAGLSDRTLAAQFQARAAQMFRP